MSAVLALDTACACPGAAPGTCEAAVILEVPVAAPGSNQLPLEEAAVKPPDADAGPTAWGSVLAPGRERRSTPHSWPHSAGMAPLLPLLLFDLHPLSSVSTSKKTRRAEFLKRHSVLCTLATGPLSRGIFSVTLEVGAGPYASFTDERTEAQRD